MTRNPSPRMRLIVESSDELIDQWGYNWPLLDDFAGVQLVGAGVMPPTSELWDGAIVAEKSTGIIWMAHLNANTGSYERKYLVYPWAAACSSGSFNIATGVTYKDVPLTAHDSTREQNFNGPTGNKIIVPVDGVYSVDGCISWASLGTGQRDMLLAFNSTDDFMRNEDLINAMSTGSRDINRVSEFAYMKAGNSVTVRCWQNSGSSVNGNFGYLNMELISPL